MKDNHGLHVCNQEHNLDDRTEQRYILEAARQLQNKHKTIKYAEQLQNTHDTI